jgi:hypothetical protein
MANTLYRQLGDGVELLGYDITPIGGTALDLILYWRTRTVLAKDYTVFVHILGPDGTLLGQVDREPRAGAYPTSMWAPGEVVADSLTIPLPDSEQELSLRLGMYQLETGQSLGGTSVELP